MEGGREGGGVEERVCVCEETQKERGSERERERQMMLTAGWREPPHAA